MLRRMDHANPDQPRQKQGETAEFTYTMLKSRSTHQIAPH
jgi:hypothetical protein